MFALRSLVCAAFVFGLGAAAHPCEGPLPARAGERFAGQVRYIVDGDGLCVGASADASTWIEVRLADFDAPELNTPQGRAARTALANIALHRSASCIVRRGRSGRVTSYDRVIAVCRIGGQSVGDLMRRAGVAEGGN